MSTVDFAGYFLHPADTAHRRYEALRAVFAKEPSKGKNVVLHYQLQASETTRTPFIVSVLSCHGGLKVVEARMKG